MLTRIIPKSPYIITKLRKKEESGPIQMKVINPNNIHPPPVGNLSKGRLDHTCLGTSHARQTFQHDFLRIINV